MIKELEGQKAFRINKKGARLWKGGLLLCARVQRGVNEGTVKSKKARFKDFVESAKGRAGGRRSNQFHIKLPLLCACAFAPPPPNADTLPSQNASADAYAAQRPRAAAATPLLLLPLPLPSPLLLLCRRLPLWAAMQADSCAACAAQLRACRTRITRRMAASMVLTGAGAASVAVAVVAAASGDALEEAAEDGGSPVVLSAAMQRGTAALAAMGRL
jgi:hypothetical protein